MPHVRENMLAWGSQMPFFNKELLKSIMTWTKLLIILLQNRNEKNSMSLLIKKKKEIS